MWKYACIISYHPSKYTKQAKVSGKMLNIKKFVGNKKFYIMVLTVAVPIMIQNGITNFVGLLNNIMVGRIGTNQMTGVAIVNQLIFVFNICIFGATSGAGIFGAQFFGCKNFEGLRGQLVFKTGAEITKKETIDQHLCD